MKGTMKFILALVVSTLLLVACSTGVNEVLTDSPPATDGGTTTTSPTVTTDPTVTPAAESVGMMPQILGVTGTVQAAAGSRSISIPVNTKKYYSNTTVDSLLLSQVCSPVITGWTNSAFPPIAGQVFKYTVLSGTSSDGTAYGQTVTVTVADNSDGTYTYSGVFDNDNYLTPASTYDTNPQSTFSIVLNYAAKTFTYVQKLYIDEYIVNDDGTIGNGWLWKTSGSGSGEYSASGMNAAGSTTTEYTDRTSGFVDTTTRSFSYVYRNRPLVPFASCKMSLLLDGTQTIGIYLYQNADKSWTYADNAGCGNYSLYDGYWNADANQ